MSKRIIVPCYDPAPGPEWEPIFQHAADVWAVILNVNSGVGGIAADPVYVAMSQRLDNAGIKRLGYSSTRYGSRPIEEVRREITQWFSQYKVDGIFADEQAQEGALLPYYRRLRSYVGDGILVTNPGTVPNEAYKDLDAIICLAETDQQTYLGKTFPQWVLNRPSSQVYHIVFSVTDPAKVLAQIDANGAAFLYLTTAVPAPGASGPEFSIPESIWPATAPTPVPAPAPPVITLAGSTDDQLVAEVRRRLQS